MPELPEMQALAERLDETFTGDRLKAAAGLQFAALKTVSPGPHELEGELLLGVGRRGKYLIFDFGTNRILVHLSQGGRVDVEIPAKTTRPKQGVVRLAFEERGAILVKEFGTERKAAWWVLSSDDEGPLERLGPEPFSQEFADLVDASDDGRRLHTWLRDQRTVAGIGRGFTDDILHAARLSPFSSMKSLTPDERKRLVDAVGTELQRGLAGERERSGGLPTKLTGRFTVHGHFGDPCPRCGDDLQRVSYESHEIAYCPACQTGGKLLADRRMSRLLK